GSRLVFRLELEAGEPEKRMPPRVVPALRGPSCLSCIEEEGPGREHDREDVHGQCLLAPAAGEVPPRPALALLRTYPSGREPDDVHVHAGRRSPTSAADAKTNSAG